MQSVKDQLFYIYDENGVKLGVKDRYGVHHDGDWHRGVQLNLVAGNTLLVQKRSDRVDIAKGLYDQSLATQLLIEDNEDELTALKRGLSTELGIDIATLRIRKVAGPVKIAKRYNYDSTLHNREFVSLYEAEVTPMELQPNNPKVEQLLWLPLDQVKQVAAQQPEQFTQTFLMWLSTVM